MSSTSPAPIADLISEFILGLEQLVAEGLGRGAELSPSDVDFALSSTIVDHLDVHALPLESFDALQGDMIDHLGLWHANYSDSATPSLNAEPLIFGQEVHDVVGGYLEIAVDIIPPPMV